jgi:adenine C2-methylase RlmN of 23S rRNA A2503 and tRNA A37
MGSALHVPLPSRIEANSTVKVTISYRTTKESTTLQWLAKEYILVDPLIHQNIHAERLPGRLKESNSRICLANVNRYTREPWHRYKVRIVL